MTKKEKEQAAVVGQRLASIRKERGLTQVELAERLGITQSLLSSYEIGRLRPNTDILVRIAGVLEVSTDLILGIEVEKKPKVDAIDRRFRKRLAALKKLPKRDQDALLRMMDSLLASRSAR